MKVSNEAAERLLESAAEKYANEAFNKEKSKDWWLTAKVSYEVGAESTAAKEYWYAQQQLEQKQATTDEEIEGIGWEESKKPENALGHKYYSELLFVCGFIKGFKQADKQFRNELLHSNVKYWLKPIPLSELLKEKDEHIKELISGMRILLLNYELSLTLDGNNPEKADSIIKAKSILQKHKVVKPAPSP